MNDLIDLLKLKLSWPIKIALAGLLILATFCSMILMVLVEESDAFLSLKEAKLIDKLLAMTPTSQVSIPIFSLALLFLAMFSGLLAIYLYIRAKKLIGEITNLYAKTLVDVVDKTNTTIIVEFDGKKITLEPKNKEGL